MTVYGRPGVYVQEAFQPLTTVSSVPGGSVPAIAAVHPRGPVTPQLIKSWSQFVTLYGTYTDAPGSMLPLAVNDFFSNGGSELYVLRCANSDATASSLALEDIEDTVNGALILTASSPGTWGTNIAVTVTPVTGSNGAAYFTLQVYLTSGGVQSVVETFPYLSMNPADSRYCIPVLNAPPGSGGSNFIMVADAITTYVAGQNDLTAVASPSPLTGGTAGSTAPVLGTIVPQMLETIQNQVLVVNLPGVSDAVTINALLAWAGTDENKLIVIDGPAPNTAILNGTSYAATVVSEYLALVQTGSPALSASSYGAVYGPWRLTQNPASSANGATVWLPQGPAVLAQIQKNDALVGPWQSPAGLEYTVTGLALETTFSASQLATLNLAGVNVIRQVAPGSGFCIMGAHTLATGYPSTYLAIRRAMMAFENDMTNLLAFALFQPNGPALWNQIQSVLNNYLQQQFQAGVFAGSTSADSYQVICDSTNNTPQTAQSGLVTVAVLVALMSPAEFIQLDLTQTTSTALTAVTS